jgi:hypothetical protein
MSGSDKTSEIDKSSEISKAFKASFGEVGLERESVRSPLPSKFSINVATASLAATSSDQRFWQDSRTKEIKNI